MRVVKPLSAILPAAALLCVLRCTGDQTVGGGSGTDVSAAVVTGRVVDTLHQPVAGGTVRLRPSEYISETGDSSSIKRNAVTDENGRFSLDSVPPGQYTIECISVDSLGWALSYMLDSIDSFPLPDEAVVKPMAVIEGSQWDTEPYNKICVRGLERSATVDSSGNFRLLLPAGERRLHLEGFTDEPPDTLFTLQPGERRDYAPKSHPLDTQKVDTLKNELNYVRELLTLNAVSVPPESVVVIEGNHITELHCDGLGLTVLPDSLSQLGFLKIINLPNNTLTALPATIDQLTRLTRLDVNTNALETVPEQLFTLESLRILDFSVNQLQTLPTTLMNLQLDSLRVSANLLCEIDLDFGKWIDQFDHEWFKRQRCPRTFPPENGAANPQ